MQMDLLSTLYDGRDAPCDIGTAGGGPDSFDRSPAAPSSAAADEVEALRLERTGRFRILRRLEPRAVRQDAPPPDGRTVRLGIIVDTETTGLDPRRCEVIEVAAIAFTYDEGSIRDVVGIFEALQEPRSGLPSEIVRLTGLTDADLKGRSIDRAALADFVRPADLVIAHNAAFDRPFCEKLDPVFASKNWACSTADVDWKKRGFDSAKLAHLLAGVGFFHGAHRALGDCWGLLEVLAAPGVSGRNDAFAQIVAASGQEIYEFRAERTPYDMRGILKERGYRWSPGTDGKPKCWLKVVDKASYGSEMHWLRYEIYRDEQLPVVRRIGAADRFRT